MSATTILLYGLSGSGKTPQIGKLAEEVYATTGKKTRVYTSDFGGTDTIDPYIDLGIIDLVELGTTNIWIFINKAVRGMVRDDKNKWILDTKLNADVGFYAFESAHGMAQLLKANMNAMAATGATIGGDTNSTFSVTDAGETIKVGSVKGFQQFGIPQQQILTSMYESFKLPAQYVMWTAGVDVGTEETSKNKIIGPMVIGGALTPILSKDFNYTFHIDAIAVPNKPARHIMYLGTHQDPNANNSTAMGNARRPLDAPEVSNLSVEPADIVKALRLVKLDAKDSAKKAISARLSKAKKEAQPEA